MMKYSPVLISIALLFMSCNGIEKKSDSSVNSGLDLSTEMVDSLFSRPLNISDRYIVQRGDTLSGIAAKFGLTVQRIKELNGIRSNVILPGMELMLKRAGTAGAGNPGPNNNKDMFMGRREDREVPVNPRKEKGGGFQWPVSGRIMSNFNPRLGREGIEIATRLGEGVRAANSGTVVFRGYIVGLGNAIVIQHPFSVLSVYGYLSEIRVECGTRVSGGDVIGEAGISGSSSACRLHFRIYVNFRGPQNPLNYLKRGGN